MRLLSLIAGAVFLIATPALGQSGDGFDLTWSTVDDGGHAPVSTADGFTLRGTIGQPDAGILMGDGFTLVGGFWQEVARSNIPTVSVWGLAAMTLLVLSAGTIALKRRRAVWAH